MRGRYKVENPDDVEFTLTITMSAKEWCELRDQLNGKWPSSRLSTMISRLLADVRRIYWHEADAVTGDREAEGAPPE